MDLTENKPFGTPQSSYDPQKTTEEIVREKSKEVIKKLENEFSDTALCQRRYRVIRDEDTGKTLINETFAVFPVPLLEENGERKIYKRLIATEFGMRVLKTTEKFEESIQNQYGGVIGTLPDYYKHGSDSSKESLQLGNMREDEKRFTLDQQNGEYGTLERATTEDIKDIIQYTREKAEEIRELRNKEKEEAIANTPAYIPEKTENEKRMDDLDALNSIDF
ncbi:MAG: hypothetical protein RBS01_02025 [Candidatus Dojkabacteria bacterium]|jgi:hypothetical protein|nr:hypothetical protein [Candidatus Dojkabacteria bacterium]